MTQPKYNHNEAIKIAKKNKYPTEFPERTADSVGVDADVSGKKIVSEFWKDSAELMFKYREEHNEKAADGVVSCRILLNAIYERIKNSR